MSTVEVYDHFNSSKRLQEAPDGVIIGDHGLPKTCCTRPNVGRPPRRQCMQRNTPSSETPRNHHFR